MKFKLITDTRKEALTLLNKQKFILDKLPLISINSTNPSEQN
ncbi:hypothetical protein DB44_GD00100 [Candidatus Protochlamydia amoebophila]|uniref:Uncharacterized protein n=1 Tax=Candidatus Protochlamydia amoebophila TaxID=362787 RepID=A0A0C1JGZ3_9BACT|nr:hypothetical protein DB44_GD00100 [Candidatus Protochlamydia amoebophila]